MAKNTSAKRRERAARRGAFAEPGNSATNKAKAEPAAARVEEVSSSATTSSVQAEPYEIVLRTRDRRIRVVTNDTELYPLAVKWNRMLTGDQRRQVADASDDAIWQESGLKLIRDLAKSGRVSSRQVDAFIESAVEQAYVQLELDWKGIETGWAARVFPWEALLTLATKPWRTRAISTLPRLVVMRRLLAVPSVARTDDGPIAWGACPEARVAGYDVDMEFSAVAAALAPRTLIDVEHRSLTAFAAQVRNVAPRVLHYVATPFVEIESTGTSGEKAPRLEVLKQVADGLAEHGPELVALSARHTGRRLAPLVVAEGARFAIGFHDQPRDNSVPLFFGAFYREWSRSGDPVAAVRAGIDAHQASDKSGRELGGVSLWSGVDLLQVEASPSRRNARDASRTASDAGAESFDLTRPAEPAAFDAMTLPVTPEQLPDMLKVSCALEPALNYSLLHNQRGGIFSRFDVLKLRPGRLDELECRVSIDSGLDRPVECRFFKRIADAPDRLLDFSRDVVVPLGGDLLRRRGEMLRGTIEVTVRCGGRQLFHQFGSIEIPPCDEWRDDEAGRSLLPSFVFPRDPAVREILSRAQPLLRAICDDEHASFLAYPAGSAQDATAADNSDEDAGDKPHESPLEAQVRAIWSALLGERLDYVNPPPAYGRRTQRIRTPEELLRARRGTCLELTLLLASCWEHIGVHPVLFLTRGHAFVGYWKDEAARRRFFDTKSLLKSMKSAPADDGDKFADPTRIVGNDDFQVTKASGAGLSASDPPWLLRARHHWRLISREVLAGRLAPVESTFLPKLKSFREATDEGIRELSQAFVQNDFDGMLDVRLARESGVTPLAIMVSGIVS